MARMAPPDAARAGRLERALHLMQQGHALRLETLERVVEPMLGAGQLAVLAEARAEADRLYREAQQLWGPDHA